jgi:hypothetical protein
VTFLLFVIGYFMAYFLGDAHGEIHERNRIERAEKKALNRTVDIRDHRR